MRVTIMSDGYGIATTYDNVNIVMVEDCDTFRVTAEGSQIVLEEVHDGNE